MTLTRSDAQVASQEFLLDSVYQVARARSGGGVAGVAGGVFLWRNGTSWSWIVLEFGHFLGLDHFCVEQKVRTFSEQSTQEVLEYYDLFVLKLSDMFEDVLEWHLRENCQASTEYGKYRSNLRSEGRADDPYGVGFAGGRGFQRLILQV